MNGEPITGSFYEKELQKVSQEKFRIEKVIKQKGDKIYMKWKGYDNSFNIWINEKDLESNSHYVKLIKYSPKPFRSFGRYINVKVDLSN